MTAPLPFRTKADIVYDELRERILSGRLQPGDRVPISRVARELGVSDIPAREGVKRLEADGLLEFATHKGAIVPRMGRHEIEELFAIRAELEALAVRRAAEEITPEQLAELRRILDAMADAEARGDVAEYGRLNREFHLGAYAAQSFVRLQTMIGSLWDSTDWCRRIFSTDTESLRSSSAEHELIYEALARGDGDAAAAAVRAQKQRAADWYLGRVEDASRRASRLALRHQRLHERGRDEQHHRGHEQQRHDELDLRGRACRRVAQRVARARPAPRAARPSSAGASGAPWRSARPIAARQRGDLRQRAARREPRERLRARDPELQLARGAPQLAAEQAAAPAPHLRRARGRCRGPPGRRRAAGRARRRPRGPAPPRAAAPAGPARRPARGTPPPARPASTTGARRPGAAAASGSASSTPATAPPALTARTSADADARRRTGRREPRADVARLQRARRRGGRARRAGAPARGRRLGALRRSGDATSRPARRARRRAAPGERREDDGHVRALPSRRIQHERQRSAAPPRARRAPPGSAR